jgi:Tfp pilus assembly protein PilO
MTAQLGRILRERRRVVVPLAAAAVLNLAVYALVVYPMSLRLAGAERRAEAARRQQVAATREFDAARAMLTSKDRADRELRAFYTDVLPPDLAGARRITYARLAQLARDANLRYDRRRYEPDTSYDGALRKLRITMVLEGEYEDVRQFIHELETAPEFVVIEDVALAEGVDSGAPLTLSLELATYFRGEADGS